MKVDVMKAAKGIEYWFRFYQTIGKGDLLNEDSIKYPLVEYLIADGDDSLSNIKLEDNHPVFNEREVDLISKDKSGKIYYCMEFKLAGKFTMQLNERQRIVDDIMRLFFVNYNLQVDSYLIVAGKSIEFLSEFRSVIGRNPGQRGRLSKKKIKENKKLKLTNPQGFYSERLLSFDINNPAKTINITAETELIYSDLYNNFNTNYLTNHNKLSLPDQIKTNLEYITEIKEDDTTGSVPAMVGIWKITK